MARCKAMKQRWLNVARTAPLIRARERAQDEAA
jgi:hypothetical protein